jgi:hypothetical protein
LIIVLGAVFAGALFLPFAFLDVPEAQMNFAAVVGLPMAAVGAFIIVAVLQQARARSSLKPLASSSRGLQVK